MALRPQHVAPELLNKVTKALGITALDQWYYVSQQAVTKAIGPSTLNSFGGTLGFLKSAYPQHHFDEQKLENTKNHEKDQKFLEIVIRKLFPNVEIQTKARKAVGIINPETDAYLEIDFWIPSLKLGIEYQDKHHYEYQWYAHGSLEDYQKRDNVKKVAMSTLGYTLITIGCWWDKSLESVAATIKKFRPDLLQGFDTSAEPISLDPPRGYINPSPVIPGVAGLMSPFIPGSRFDPTNWYAGEKHDGIRGVYNPYLHKMFSRSGNELSVLPALLQDVPHILVEGEIVAGRGSYSKTSVVSYHTHPDKVNWPLFRYVIFDVPDDSMGNYTNRYSAIMHGLSTHPFIFAQPAFRILIADKAHLKMLLDATISDGGEGMIVQKDEKYEYGRAKGVAKIKVRRDADAEVLSVNEQSCTCSLENGVSVEIDFSNGFDPSNLKAGYIISYYHNGYTPSGEPRQAEIYKIRYDITSEHLNSDKPRSKNRSVKEASGSKSLITQNTGRRMGYWNKSTNVRAFFDEFARKSGFDPLVPENWYSVTVRDVQSAECGGLLYPYGFSVKKALVYAYPELKFSDKFRTRERNGHWHESANARALLGEFARTAGFDPLVPENWYPVRVSTLHNAGGGSLLSAHDFKLKSALSCGYPEVKFEDKFRKSRDKIRVSKGYWTKVANVRAFFDEFARNTGFDALEAKNWYKVRTRTVHKAGGGSLVNYYGGLQKALNIAYPESRFQMNDL